ncbi:hypothetical protein [Streptomyces sp. RB17]|uniref:hypothetical protein n=1 Tax=Streptomyces sp. RB17 TaxID=2585197 RepID=UPI00129643F0|nr:hypothetical protein [Streptomyces sp. RB17]
MGQDPFRPADALYGDPVADLDKVLDTVAGACAGRPADAGSVPTPPGRLPLPRAGGRGAPDADAPAWGIAVATAATDQNRPLTPAPAAGLRPVAAQHPRHPHRGLTGRLPARPGLGAGVAGGLTVPSPHPPPTGRRGRGRPAAAAPPAPAGRTASRSPAATTC